MASLPSPKQTPHHPPPFRFRAASIASAKITCHCPTCSAPGAAPLTHRLVPSGRGSDFPTSDIRQLAKGQAALAKLVQHWEEVTGAFECADPLESVVLQPLGITLHVSQG